ncbi:ribosome maturation factor RimM [Paraliomyxa miuraensis]|uniref:ribosome maturation factor RimM n=1 Tax=Paraliomyxa miuraensis TaxID=376150 RepID=UPI0022598E88|nr:ribosome maturation factor RimM [Paraliomyxa miuraensis]MCX4239211.1 ribosome maturation factor RimM [Paraliomyxa miuraensis]
MPLTGAKHLVVGYVAGAHGIRGGVRVHLHDRESEALVVGRSVVLQRDGRPLSTHELRSVEPVPGKPGRHRVTMIGVGDRNAADALRGCEVLVDRGELPELPEDEFYLADAIGLPVEREHDGATRALGTIAGITSNGVQDLFEVQWRGPDGRMHEWLLPVLPQHIVELDERRVLVRLPLGLLPDALEASDS